MSNVSFPFTSVGGDRKVTAFQEAQGFDMFVSSGVVEPSPGDLEDALEVTAVPDAMQVSVAVGKAVILGHRLITDAASTLTLDAGGAQGRIDVIVAEANRENAVRAVRLLVVKGTEGASPSPPALTETDAIYQIPLAWVSVPAGATTLNAATITDKREASRPRGMSSEAITAVQEFPYKKAVRVATTGSNLAALSGLLTIDEVTVEAGDRVLVKDQTDAEDNGIYEAASSAWVRAVDFDSDGKAVSQMLIPVEQGTANGGTVWQLITESPITLDTTELEFERFDTDDITAGNGLQRTADVISMRTPGNISLTSTNKADGTDHTHALVLPGLTPKSLTLSTTNDVAADGHTHVLDVDIPTYLYKCTGSEDDAAITALVNAFLEGTGAWAGTTHTTLKVVVSGELGLRTNQVTLFAFSSTQTRGARVIIDWSDAQGFNLSGSLTGGSRILLGHAGAGCRIIHTGLSADLINSHNDLDNKMYGISAWSNADVTVLNSRINVYGASPYGVYASQAARISLRDSVISVESAVEVSAGNRAAGAATLSGGSIIADNCTISAEATNGVYESTGSIQAAAVRLSTGGDNVRLTNCDLLAVASGYGSYGFGIYAPGSIPDASFFIYAHGCRIRGYAAGTSCVGYGVQAGDGTLGCVRLVNNSFPTVSLEGYTQTGAIKLDGTTAGEAYLIANNAFAGANSSPNIVKHSDSDPADNYAMSGNMFGVNLG